MQIKILGPVDDVTGYGEVARQIVFNLHYIGAEVSVQPQNWGCTIISLPLDEKQLIEQFKTKKEKYKNNLYINVPLFFRHPDESVNIGLTMSEVDGIPPNWVNYCNSIDRVLVPSKFNIKTFIQSGVEPENLRLLPLGVNQCLFTPEGPVYKIEQAKDLFTFLSVGVWTPRKGFDLLIKAFVQEFSKKDNVCLILKCHCNGSDYDPTGSRIQKEIDYLVKNEKTINPPHIYLVPQTVPSHEMPSLYRMSHCYVSATRGEGWSMPLFESLLCGRPVITTNWSAYLDYLNDENSYLVNTETIEPVPSLGLCTEEMYIGYRWAKPSIEHLRFQMRFVYENYTEAMEKAQYGRKLVKTRMNWKTCAQQLIAYFNEFM